MATVTDPARTPPAPASVLGRDDPPVLGANPFVGLTRRQVGAAVRRLLGRVAVEPGVLVTGAIDAARELRDVTLGRSDRAPDLSDERFVDPAWANNPVYRRLLQAYLVERDALYRLVDEVGLDDKSRERARLALSLVAEAAAPTNTLLGNPTALSKAWRTRGQSLIAGLRHFGHDLRHNRGMPSMVDTRPFKIGENIAVTPGEVIHRSELFELIQYAPAGSRTFRRPFVVVPPQINKYYISDLAPGRSFVEHTVAAGISYFTISWRNPTPAQRDWDLAAYVSACKEALEVACDISAATDANVAGMCAGGITLACLLGHLAAAGESLVNSATFMVAGLDTSSQSTVGLLTSTASLDAARARSQRRGVLDGHDLGRMFAWLRPNDLVWNYWINNYLLGQNPPAFDILYWNADTTNLTAGLHSDFLDLIGSNGLTRPGSLELLGTPIDLGKVRCDAYVVAGAKDHIIPWTGAYQTTQMLGGDSQFVLGSSGHIQAIVNPPGNRRSNFLTQPGPPPPDPLEWRAGATANEGSWWDHWLRWLGERSGDQRRAPAKLGNRRHPPIEAAPGRYVHL